MGEEDNTTPQGENTTQPTKVEESDNLEDILGEDNVDNVEELDEFEEHTRYVINIGKPFWITIRDQEHIRYFQEDGRQVEVMVLMKNDVRDNSETATSYGVILNTVEKVYLYFYNGTFKGKKVVPLGHSFQVRDWPHIIKCPIGTNKMDEIFYNLPVGQTMQIERGSDVDILIKKYGYVLETDKGGNVPQDNPYFRQIQEVRNSISEEMITNFNKMVSEMQRVDLKDFPKQTKDAEPVALARTENREDVE